MEWGAESGDLALFLCCGGGWLVVRRAVICEFGRIFASFGIYLRVLGYICDFAGFICEFSILFATWGGGGGSVEREAGWKGAAAGRILATFSFY
ncbi:hypothetical protein CYJ37_19515 [Bacillus sp. UMB0728]|nr:hypothetical protein CYJ37_19515 [Bacillus sp. UMB0728]